MFRIGAHYALDEMRKRIGNFQAQQVFPQIGSEIVCGLFKLKQNPRAPEEALIGVGPRMSAKAAKLAEERTVFPVFLKDDSGFWEYRGRYHVSRMLEEGDPEARRIWRQRGRTDPPGTVLYLDQVEGKPGERPVTRYFTHYWTNDTWELERSLGYEQLDHTASNLFRKRGIEPGDFIYVITQVGGNLILGGRLEVGRLLDQSEAEKLRGENLWKAKDHAIAREGSSTAIDFEREVPTSVLRKLRFVAGDREKAPVLKADGTLDQQTLRGVRQLTFDSAQLLESLLFTRSESTSHPKGESRPEPTNSGIMFPNLEEILVEPPSPEDQGEDAGRKERSYHGKLVDHAEKDAANRVIGRRGEEFVGEYERRFLTKAGRADLASKVRLISETEGDGAGYDVLSFDTSGRVKYIEVKTTTGGKTTPFIVTLNEVEFSEDHPVDYSLYRVFDLDAKARMFILKGSLRGRCKLKAVRFRASF